MNTDDESPAEAYINQALESGDDECAKCYQYGFLRPMTPERIGCLSCGTYATVRWERDFYVVTWDAKG